MGKEIYPKGSPSALVWVIANDPYDQDADKGYMFSGGYGYTYDKMLKEAGLASVYITCVDLTLVIRTRLA